MRHLGNGRSRTGVRSRCPEAGGAGRRAAAEDAGPRPIRRPNLGNGNGRSAWTLATRALVAVTVLGALAVGACDTETFFHECPLSRSIVDACAANSTTTTLTCVVADHPLCDEKICASWQDSTPFCTRACSLTSDCPDGSTCVTYLDFAFCVPATVLTPATTAP